jgi:ubiquinone/menaquinone biosynthesis C-methylase UbiE
MNNVLNKNKNNTDTFLNKYIIEFLNCNNILNSKDKDFAFRVYSTPLSKYISRIKSINFSNGHVLDACAGFGQWSIALALLNFKITSFDVLPERIGALKYIANKLNIHNINTDIAQLDNMPYKNNSFDFVFCYGSIFCTPWKESLKEIHRVTKPGGKVYLTANAIGYQAYLWCERPNEKQYFDPREFVSKAFANTLEYEKTGLKINAGQIIIAPKELAEYSERIGFKVVSQGEEGTINLTQDKTITTPFFKGKYMELPCCHEIILQK